MTEEYNCDRCGSSEIFLRKKGNATGLYCLGCGKWYKWVGKKDVKTMQHRGFKVHPEDYTPEVKTTTVHTSQTGKSNNPLQTNHGNLGQITEAFKEETLDNYIEEDEFELEEEEEENETYFSEDPCPVCVSGTLDSMVKTDKVKITIFDDVLSVWSKDNTTLHGSFKIKHCPHCGKRI